MAALGSCPACLCRVFCAGVETELLFALTVHYIEKAVVVRQWEDLPQGSLMVPRARRRVVDAFVCIGMAGGMCPRAGVFVVVVVVCF